MIPKGLNSLNSLAAAGAAAVRDAADAAVAHLLRTSAPAAAPAIADRPRQPPAHTAAIRRARLVCTRAASYIRSREARADVLRRTVAIPIANLLGLVDRPDPAPAAHEVRERARAVGYRLRLGAGTEVEPSPARS